MLEFRSHDGASPGIALVRDGNGTRSFDTLMRYRNAAMAEFMRALRTLKALQAGQGSEHAADPEVVLELPQSQQRGPARLASRPAPNEPERRPDNEYVIPGQPGPGRTLHEPAACWMPNEPEPGRDRHEAAMGFPRPHRADESGAGPRSTETASAKRRV